MNDIDDKPSEQRIQRHAPLPQQQLAEATRPKTITQLRRRRDTCTRLVTLETVLARARLQT
jgi:hypothetical protein